MSANFQKLNSYLDVDVQSSEVAGYCLL